MSKWINADAVKINYIGGFKDTFEIDYDSFMNAPSIDIVRCFECKYWGGCKNTMHNSHQCGRAAEEHNADYWTRADDFCSWGERE